MPDEIRIDGKPLEGAAGRFRFTITDPADPVYTDSIEPADITHGFTIGLELDSLDAYKRVTGIAVRPPQATVGITIRRIHVRSRLARLGPLVRRPRGRRLLRATFSRIDITIPSVQFRAPDEGEHA